MEAKKVRIFAISSFIGALFCAIHKKKNSDSSIDILVLDEIRISDSHKELIILASRVDAFDIIVDLTLQLSKKGHSQPTSTKQWTRKLKTKPGFKILYNFLYQFVEKKRNKRITERISSQLNMDISSSELDIYVQPQHAAYESLIQSFPSANIIYCEHGIGDYIDIFDRAKWNHPFCNVFHDSWRKFIPDPELSISIFDPGDFVSSSMKFKALFPKQVEATRKLVGETSKLSLVCLQALERYGVKGDFWFRFLDKARASLDEDPNRTFLIKQHPFQSIEILDSIKEYFHKNNLNYLIIDDPILASFSIEILYYFIADKLECVISPFSSSIFYLARLNKDSDIKCYYNIDDAINYKGIPDLYVSRWEKLKLFVEKVFDSDSLVLLK